MFRELQTYITAGKISIYFLKNKIKVLSRVSKRSSIKPLFQPKFILVITQQLRFGWKNHCRAIAVSLSNWVGEVVPRNYTNQKSNIYLSSMQIIPKWIKSTKTAMNWNNSHKLMCWWIHKTVHRHQMWPQGIPSTKMHTMKQYVDKS